MNLRVSNNICVIESKSLKIDTRPLSHAIRPSLLPITLLPSTHHHKNLCSINPTLRTNPTTLDDFHETPARHTAAEVPVYDHDDHMGMVKYTRALEIAEGRPNPLPPPPSALPPSMADKRKPTTSPSFAIHPPLRSCWLRRVGKPEQALRQVPSRVLLLRRVPGEILARAQEASASA